MEKTFEELKAFQQARAKKSLDWYYRMKKDPVKWEKYKQKRQKREKLRYDRINKQLKEVSNNDNGSIDSGDLSVDQKVRKGEGKIKTP
jgi:FlaA1/EpsC-like NDP-sugar epimerase